MAKQTGKEKVQIVLEEGSHLVVVRGGIKVEFNDGGIDVYGNVPVALHAPVNDTASGKSGAKKELESGDRMEDGTIFAGVSPDTGENMFVTPRDASGTLKWAAAMIYAADLDAGGHRDWKLPTRAELDVLYQNRDKGALKGTFDESGSYFAGWYWSSTESPDGSDDAWMQRFNGDSKVLDWKDNAASVRPVRAEPRLEPRP